MSFGLKSSTLAAGVALIASGVVQAASPVPGFGPTIRSDRTLNENLGALTETIAWRNSPEGDVYRLALLIPAPEMPFENVAMESSPRDNLPADVQIRNDRTLNASLDALSQVIAWQKSPEGDAFQYALEDHVKGADFQQVALASIPPGGFPAER